MSDAEQPAPDQPQATPPKFLPFVGFQTPAGEIILRRWDAIRGFNSRVDLNESDGCEVLLHGEKAITAKTSMNAIISQVRAAEHWSKVRDIQESVAVQNELSRRQSSGLVVPR
jgi:hypothetical protein